MRVRPALALAALLAATPASAALDAYTEALRIQPMTHLDWLVLHAREEMKKSFQSPTDPMDGTFDRYKASLARSNLTPDAANAYFSFNENRLTLVVVAAKQGAPTQDECALVLNSARDGLLRAHRYTMDPPTSAERKQGAEGVLEDLMVPPARVGRAGLPDDMSRHMAALTGIYASVHPVGNLLGSASCTGSLSGTDVNVRIRD